jgi:hypothetical protein
LPIFGTVFGVTFAPDEVAVFFFDFRRPWPCVCSFGRTVVHWGAFPDFCQIADYREDLTTYSNGRCPYTNFTNEIRLLSGIRADSFGSSTQLGSKLDTGPSWLHMR